MLIPFITYGVESWNNKHKTRVRCVLKIQIKMRTSPNRYFDFLSKQNIIVPLILDINVALLAEAVLYFPHSMLLQKEKAYPRSIKFFDSGISKKILMQQR